VVLVLAVSAVLGTTLNAEEFSNLPYRDICNGMNIDFSGNVDSLPREMDFTMKSERPDLKLSDVRVTLKSAEESFDIAVSPAGDFKLPVKKSLFDADAVLVVNQPWGALQVMAKGAVKGRFEDISVPINQHAREGRIAFNDLAQAAIEGRDRWIEKKKKEAAAARTEWRNVEEVGDADSQWMLVVTAREDAESANVEIVNDPPKPDVGPLRKGLRKMLGERGPIKKMGPGGFFIPYTEQLRKENPMIVLSPNPSWECAIVKVPKASK